MKNHTFYIVVMILSLTNAISDTYSMEQQALPVNLESLPDELLAKIFENQLERDNLVPSIHKLWEQREVNHRFKNIITPANIVYWIKERNIGIGSLPLRRSTKNRFDNLTPLMQAIYLNDNLVTDILLEGGTVNERNSKGTAPILFAVSYGTNEIIKKLLNTPNINIDAQDNVGLNAIINAVIHGNPDRIKLLLEHNPNVTLKLGNNYPNERQAGKSALDLVKETKTQYPVIYELFKEYYPEINSSEVQPMEIE